MINLYPVKIDLTSRLDREIVKPEQSIICLPFTEEEAQRILAEWREARMEFPNDGG